MSKKFSKQILNAPLPPRGRHWVEKLTKEEQQEIAEVWRAYQEGRTTLTISTLARRMKKELPQTTVEWKQMGIWLRDPEGLSRCTKL